MIQFHHLTYRYPNSSQPALEEVDIHIGQAGLALVTGYSGSGKSTLLRCLNGLIPHFTGGRISGSLSVMGHDPIAEGPHRLSRVVGFVFQDPEAQFVTDRVEDEIAFGLENAALPLTEMRLRVEEVLDLLGLAALRNRPIETLSGGEKQRVAIAAALALRPQVLALDEPTSQLDPQSAEEVLQALLNLNRELGLTVVLAEHRMERVLSHADHLIYLSQKNANGSRVLSGPPRHVLKQMDLTPPLVTLAKRLGWDPLPLTIKEGRQFVQTSLPPVARDGSLSSPEVVSSPPERLTPGDLLLRVRDLSFAYNGQPVLKGVNLDVREGELVVLMGRNGSGKTTLLRCIAGILRPQRGHIDLEGEPIVGREVAEICRRVGYLPQQPDDLLFADTVLDELIVTLRNHGMLQQPPLAPTTLLARLGLGELAGAYPRDLSVGQRQRVALGAVTVTRPRVLILDEPTRGMDYLAKQELLNLLREWQAEGTGILLVTHDVELAALAANRIVVLSQGEVIADAAPSEVLTGSPLFATQIARLFPGRGWLTVEDALRGLRQEACPCEQDR